MPKLNLKKTQAKEELLFAIQSAFDRVTDDALRHEMSAQMARVEKLFGYVPHSWTRGC